MIYIMENFIEWKIGTDTLTLLKKTEAHISSILMQVQDGGKWITVNKTAHVISMTVVM